MTTGKGLIDFLADQLAGGVRIDCMTDAGRRHLSEDPEIRAAAALGCQPCPALNLCASYADTFDRSRLFGVWGGQDRSHRKRTTPNH